MKTSPFKVSTNLCGECSLALRRFVGVTDGVASVAAGNGMFAVSFDKTTTEDPPLDSQPFQRNN